MKYAAQKAGRFLRTSLSICFFLVSIWLHAQESGQVYLKGRQFMLDGQPFTPIVMNYQLDFCVNGSNYYMTPDHSYNTTNFFECTTSTNCSGQIQTDLNYIATMGFNAIRVTFSPKLESGQLKINFVTHPGINPIVKMNVNPTNPSDPGLLKMFAFYDKVLELANNTVKTLPGGSTVSQPLKVIFLFGPADDLTPSEVSVWNNYFDAVSDHFSSCANKNAMLAYDLLNEPNYHVMVEQPKKTKQEACNIISGWYNTIKGNDPNHLVTLGGSGHEDVFSFDPSVLKLDFYSLHTYPGFKPFEDRTQSAVQDRARKRVLVDMLWLDRTLGMPWIIGETGFSGSAHPDATIANGLDGTLANQESFANVIVPGCFACGGTGFSWWNFQDVHYYSLGHEKYKHNFFGLIERSQAPVSKKAAAGIFNGFIPGLPGNCTSEYTSSYSNTKLYYNRFNYPANPSKEVYGYVKDPNGDPIADAVVYAQVKLYTTSINGQPEEVRDGIYAFTDQTGYFKIIPYYFTSIGTPPGSPPSDWGVKSLEVSAPAAERKVFGCSTCTNVGTLTLQHEDVNITSVSGITIGNGLTGSYVGKKSLSITNTNVNVGGTAQFLSVREINITGTFTANSNVLISCEPIPPNCSVFSTYAMQKQSGQPFAAENDSSDMQEDIKEEAGETSVSIFPNPTGQSTTIRLNGGGDKVISDVTVFDLLGHAIYSRQVGSASVTVDVSGFPKGVYLVQVNDPGKTHFHKISVY